MFRFIKVFFTCEHTLVSVAFVIMIKQLKYGCSLHKVI